MGQYFDSALMMRQMMVGGSLYTPAWYISLAKGGSDPYATTRATWEITGTSTPLTTGWQNDPLNTSQNYTSAIQNVDTVDVPVPFATTITYWVIRNGLSTDQWQFIGRFNNYPLSVATGDIVRFAPGNLKIAFST